MKDETKKELVVENGKVFEKYTIIQREELTINAQTEKLKNIENQIESLKLEYEKESKVFSFIKKNSK